MRRLVLLLGASTSALWSVQLVGDAAGSHSVAVRSAQDRPNIVVIMADDMRNDDLRFMPWTRRLVADRGVRFRNAFAPFPLCCPARASALTGLYPHNHRVLGIDPPYGFTSFDDRSTFATWLHQAGYATVYVGKYLNGYGERPEPGAVQGSSLAYVPPGWSDWRASIDGGLPPGHPARGNTYQYFDTTLSRNGEGFTSYEGRYQTRVYGELTERIISRRAASSTPFLLQVSYTAPHDGYPKELDDPEPVTKDDGVVLRITTPARPRDVWGDMDSAVKAAPGASWLDPDFTDKPTYLQNPPMNRAEKRALLEKTRQRAEALKVVDAQVRRTIRALDEAGELGRTFVFFTSDNGYFLGEQRRRAGKTLPHQPSLRVPMLVRGPGIPAGQVRDDPFTLPDLAPTVAAAAGVRPGREVDGISLLDVARRGDQGWRRGVVTETGRWGTWKRSTDWAGNPLAAGETPDPRFAIGIRTSRYLYVDLASGEHELYDVVADPREYHNLARVPAYDGLRARFAEALERLRACRGDACNEPLPAALSLPLAG